MSLLKLLLSIVIPPAGVFLTKGIGSALIVNVILTLFGWLPGAIHAVWILSKANDSEQAQSGV